MTTQTRALGRQASQAGRAAPPPRPARRYGDRGFRIVATGSGVVVLAVMAAIGVFLFVEAIPALRANAAGFVTTQEWNPDASPSRFGIAALAYGTLVSSALALIMATPVAVGVALFTSHYAPRRLRGALATLTDLLAAVPSVVYGLWGLVVLAPALAGRSLFTAGLVLAIMVLPIVAAISREAFLRVPREQEEAALALGATRWETIRLVVVPHARHAVAGAAMLGVGRALGETVAVALVLSSTYRISADILGPGGNTFAANIANTFGMAGPTGRSALIASGLVLFLITLVVTLLARVMLRRTAVR